MPVLISWFKDEIGVELVDVSVYVAVGILEEVAEARGVGVTVLVGIVTDAGIRVDVFTRVGTEDAVLDTVKVKGAMVVEELNSIVFPLPKPKYKSRPMVASKTIISKKSIPFFIDQLISDYMDCIFSIWRFNNQNLPESGSRAT